VCVCVCVFVLCVCVDPHHAHRQHIQVMLVMSLEMNHRCHEAEMVLRLSSESCMSQPPSASAWMLNARGVSKGPSTEVMGVPDHAPRKPAGIPAACVQCGEACSRSAQSTRRERIAALQVISGAEEEK
jgi:hypothetical protein